jgi:hypothetical protein
LIEPLRQAPRAAERTRRSHGAGAVARALASAVWLVAAAGVSAFAPPSALAQASKPAPSAPPEQHAAPGANESSEPAQTATPPEDPLAIPEDVKKRLGTDVVEDDMTRGQGPKGKIDFYGPYFAEQNGRYSFRTVFPFWFERRQPDVAKPKEDDRSSLFGLLYFNRRSPSHDADVLFPLFWNFRDYGTTTTVVGPFMHQETKPGVVDASGKKSVGGHANWLPPLFFQGESDDGKGYLHIPPLLTFTQHTDRSGLHIVGPAFCKWRGGPACDPRTADTLDMGVAPFYFYGKNPTSEYEIVPPLLHYYKYEKLTDTYLNVWGPYVREKRKSSDFEAVAPFWFHTWSADEDQTTVFPFFHYGRTWGKKGDSHLLVTPLFVDSKSANGDRTFVSPLYARHRGRTELDMITPFFWQYRDPDAKLTRTVVPPFFYQQTSPRGEDTVAFPFYARFKREGLSDTIWVTPLFRHVRDVTGWETDLFPFFFMGRSNKSQHFVLAPFVWDFSSPRSRTTVVLPAFFRHEDDTSVTQLVLNTYYQEKRHPKGREYEFHFFPLFSFGEKPNGHWWNILYGLAGFTREGSATSMRAMWLPIELSR